jgi:hypothetical protein
VRRCILPGLAIPILLASTGAVAADCAPAKLVRMVTQNSSPGIPADSFARQPKVTWRLGNGQARVEERHDPSDNVQMLSIIDVPRAWQIDLVSKSGEMMVDDSDPPTASLPVFSEETLPAEILGVEYGCERQFIQDAGTTHDRSETKAGVAIKHSIRSGRWKFTIVTREGSDVPMLAVLSQDDKVVGAVRYLAYETLESTPDGLFAPPPGVAITSPK